MPSDATIVEVPRPPAGRLPFLRVTGPRGLQSGGELGARLLLKSRSWSTTISASRPSLSWIRELIQTVLLDDIESFTKNADLRPRAGRGWRRGGPDRRRRALAMATATARAAVPRRGSCCLRSGFSFRLLCSLAALGDVDAGSLQPIHAEIAAATLKVLEDTVLGADLPAEDHQRVSAAVPPFCSQPSGGSPTHRSDFGGDTASRQRTHGAGEPRSARCHGQHPRRAQTTWRRRQRCGGKAGVGAVNRLTARRCRTA